jgi:hypothetical protein
VETSRNTVAWTGGMTCYTYLRLIRGADPSQLEKQIMAYMEVVINKEYRPIGYQMIPYLEKIGDIHLNSDTQPEYELGQKGSHGQIIIFSGIGLLILLIACCKYKYSPFLQKSQRGFNEENIRF